jgi:hypothetical protein
VLVLGLELVLGLGLWSNIIKPELYIHNYTWASRSVISINDMSDSCSVISINKMFLNQTGE